ALRALSVEPEQRVALVLPDGVDFAAAFLGAIKIGAVAVPLNTRLDPADLAALLADSRAKVLVADPGVAAALAPAVSAAGLRAAVTFDELVRAAESRPLPAEPVGLDATALWIYTSGTTGTPKAAMHVHRTLLAGHHYGRGVLGLGAGDRVLATSKLFFAYALGNALLNPLLARASSYLDPGWAVPAAVARVARDYRPTLFFSVPTFYAHLLRADLPRDTFGSARLCVSAGERLPEEIHRAWADRFGVEILDGMGTTETIFMVLSNRPGQRRPGASGVPVPGPEVELRRADGAATADGEAGVLWVKTPSAAVGYWRRVDQSRRTFVGEWIRTGDVYHRDADGHYVHGGREDERFKVAGQWVVPGELEALARRHPGVLEAGAVGAEDTGGLVQPLVFVVPRDPALHRARPRAEGP